MVTVNDYLARRDQEWIGPIYEFLMLRVDCIDKHRPHSRSASPPTWPISPSAPTTNSASTTCATTWCIGPDELVQRKHHFAIVDEVDSVLIDDARTPLIISGPSPAARRSGVRGVQPDVEAPVSTRSANWPAQFLTEASRLFVEGKTRLEEGEAGLALLRAHRALPKNSPLIKFLSEEGAKCCCKKQKTLSAGE